MMTVHTDSAGWAWKLGKKAGGLWRTFTRQERKAASFLSRQGLPAGIVIAALWIFKLATVAVLLYLAFWFALLLLFAVAVAWSAHNTDEDDEPETEWRTGASGFGLYRGDVRVDAGDPNEED